MNTFTAKQKTATATQFRAIGIDAMSLFSFDSTLAVIGTTATADAPTRIAAMLAALEGE